MNGRYHSVAHFRMNVDHILDEAEREARQKAARVREVAAQLQALMTAEAYDAWWNNAPDDGFLAAAEKKLAEELAAWETQERYAEMIAKRRVEFVDAIQIHNLVVQQVERMGFSTIEAAQDNLDKCIDLWDGRDFELYTRRLQDEIRKEKGV